MHSSRLAHDYFETSVYWNLHINKTNRPLTVIHATFKMKKPAAGMCNGCLETGAFPPYPHSQRDLDQYKVKV